MAEPSNSAYLLLDVAGTACALPRECVREVLPLPNLHAPPAAGGPLAGFLNLAGAPVPILDLALLLGLRERSEPDPYRHVALAADGSLGLLVDRAIDLIRPARHHVRPVDEAHTLNGCVVAEISLDGRLVHVLSLSRILTEEERSRLDIHTRWSAERLAALDAA